MNDLFAELWSVYLARIVRLLIISFVSTVVIFAVTSGIDAVLPDGNQPAIDEILASVPEGESLTNEQLQEIGELQFDDLPLIMLRAFLRLTTLFLIAAVAAGAYMFVIGAHYVVGRVLVSEAIAFASQRAGSLMIATSIPLATVFTLWGVMFIAPVLIAEATSETVFLASLFALLSFTGFVGVVVITAYITVRWALIWPVIAFEGLTSVAALRRSWALTEDFWWRTFGKVIIVVLAVFAIEIPGLMAISAGLETVGTWYSNLIAPSIALPILLIAIFLLYADLRTRKETPPGYGPDQIAQDLNFRPQTWDDTS